METQSVKTPKIYKAKRSIKLSEQEWDCLKSVRAKFPTEVAAAQSIGLDRWVYNRICLVGSCSEGTYKHLNKVLFSKKQIA